MAEERAAAKLAAAAEKEAAAAMEAEERVAAKAAMEAKESDEVLPWYAVKEVAAQREGESWMVRRVADAGASAAVVDAMLAASGATSIGQVRGRRASTRVHAARVPHARRV